MQKLNAPLRGERNEELFSIMRQLDNAGLVAIEAIMHCMIDFKQVLHFDKETYHKAIKLLQQSKEPVCADAAEYIKLNLLGGTESREIMRPNCRP